ncbi:exonuclease domain-containing protein [Herbiconiux oxytropis]|uniref:exonuclease domain-containing protein n=1 Tax=Herbiconiux oxytropis TaxID=2970915 RepID=UPI0035C73A1B
MSEFERAGAQPGAWGTLCTLRLSQRLFPGAPSTLGALCERLQTARKPSHSALDDAEATAEALQRMLVLAREDATSTEEGIGVHPLVLGAKWAYPAATPRTVLR